MAKTARQIISSSLRKIGSIASGETASADEMQDGLSALQGLIDTWSNSDLLAFTESIEEFPLIPGQQEYTMGPDGDFETSRPMEILGIAVKLPTSVEVPVNMLKFEQWRDSAVKNVQAEYPSDIFFKREWPSGRLMSLQVPTTDYLLMIYSRKPLIKVVNLNSVIDLPPGYERALIYNLCPDLVDEYGGEVTNSVASIMKSSLADIKTQNLSQNVPYAASAGEVLGDHAKVRWTMSDFYKGGG